MQTVLTVTGLQERPVESCATAAATGECREEKVEITVLALLASALMISNQEALAGMPGLERLLFTH
jgi:hypothetical protein